MDSIRRLGFSRWHGRRLIEGHAWFASAFLCLIAVLACLEGFGQRGSAATHLADAAMGFAAIVVGAYALNRYQRILTEAMKVAERATCAGCGAYASFTEVSPSGVRCTKCRHSWHLVDGD